MPSLSFRVMHYDIKADRYIKFISFNSVKIDENSQEARIIAHKMEQIADRKKLYGYDVTFYSKGLEFYAKIDSALENLIIEILGEFPKNLLFYKNSYWIHNISEQIINTAKEAKINIKNESINFLEKKINDMLLNYIQRRKLFLRTYLALLIITPICIGFFLFMLTEQKLIICILTSLAFLINNIFLIFYSNNL